MTTESTTVVSKPVSVLDNEEPLVDERLRMLGRVRAHGTYDIRVRATSLQDTSTTPLSHHDSLITTSITLRTCDANIDGCFVLRPPASSFLRAGAGRQRTVSEIKLIIHLPLHENSELPQTMAVEVFQLSGVHRYSMYRSEDAGVQHDSLSISITEHLLDWLPSDREPRYIQIELNNGTQRIKSLTLEVTQKDTIEPADATDDCELTCTLHSRYVNFTESEQPSWILAPSGFFENYCSATTTKETGESLTGSRCVATAYRPLRIFYKAGENDYRSHVLPRMSVVACGCV